MSEDKNLEIFKKLKSILLNIKPNIDINVLHNNTMIKDLGLSSFEIFVFIHDVEIEFKIEIAEQNIHNNFNLEDMINMIMQNK